MQHYDFLKIVVFICKIYILFNPVIYYFFKYLTKESNSGSPALNLLISIFCSFSQSFSNRASFFDYFYIFSYLADRPEIDDDEEEELSIDDEQNDQGGQRIPGRISDWYRNQQPHQQLPYTVSNTRLETIFRQQKQKSTESATETQRQFHLNYFTLFLFILIQPKIFKTSYLQSMMINL